MRFLELAISAALAAGLQDPNAPLEKAEKLLEEARQALEAARSSGKPQDFAEAAFKLEESRIRWRVLQEGGTGDAPKTAAERLRAVDQVGRLIRESRAASGTPRAAATEPKSGPAPKQPVPAAPAIASAEKLVKSVFKDGYAKKGAAEQRALSKDLLAQAGKTQSDPAGLYVLYREAADAGVRAGDSVSALEALEALCRDFDVDPVSLRTALLGGLAKTAKSPEESASAARANLDFAEACAVEELHDLAQKAAAAAQPLAKRSGDAALVQKTAALAKDVGDLKVRCRNLRDLMESYVKDPGHEVANLELGQHLCFVKGQWEVGLRYLAKGSEDGLKGLALRELRGPTEAQELVDLAERWTENAEKERNGLRKTRIMDHVRALFEAALPVSTGLLRARAEKALGPAAAAVPAPAPAGGAAPAAGKDGAVDLLALVDPVKDTVLGTWRIEKRELIGGNGNRARIQIPYVPPDEYDLVVVAERKSGEQTISFGLLARGSIQWALLVDAYIPTYRSAIDCLDGKGGADNETTVQGRQFPTGRTMTFEFKVRKSGISVLMNGKPFTSYQGDLSRLTMPGQWAGSEPGVPVFGYSDGEIRYTKISLTPVSGQGRLLR